MNPAILKIASLVLQSNAKSKGTPVESGKNNTGFMSLIQKSMNSVHKQSSAHLGAFTQARLPGNKGFQFYLESLRKALLATGKPLEQIRLKGKDFSILERFLCQCGFSQERAKSLLRELVESDPRREINLSQFFRKVSELDHDKRGMHLPVIVEPSAIPYIESVLRGCGLTAKQLDHAFSAARAEAGGLNLHKLAGELKVISAKITAQGNNLANKLSLDQFVKALEDLINRVSVSKGGGLGDQIKPDQHVLHQIPVKLDGKGMRSPHWDKGGQISMKNFVFEQETGVVKVCQGIQVPTDIRDTIEQIVERAVITEEREGFLAPALSLSRLKLTNLHGREKIATHGKVDKKESFLSPLESKGHVHAKNGEQKVGSPYPGSKDGLPLGLDTAQGMKGKAEEQGNDATSRTKTGDIPQHISNNSQFSDTITGVKQNQKSLEGNFLPAYLVNQVGKQVARSALRGERVIRLHLKPPELGAVKVEMDIKGDILKLWITTENSSVREVLLSNVHELRETLVEQGVKLERLDVQIDYHFNESMGQSKESPRDRQEWIQEIDGISSVAGDDRPDSVSLPWIMLTGDHALVC
ncbi:MAG: flagellar hook-length control protein FliK [Deltaproteobacteria bacterium]|nr:flagellar hook-length control protein FliK [Deltaproteobacteria bacterium]